MVQKWSEIKDKLKIESQRDYNEMRYKINEPDEMLGLGGVNIVLNHKAMGTGTSISYKMVGYLHTRCNMYIIILTRNPHDTESQTKIRVKINDSKTNTSRI